MTLTKEQDQASRYITGSYFAQGSTHDVCQDYAESKSNKYGDFAALADGCSSSPQTDIGARVLVRSALGEWPNTSTLSVLDRTWEPRRHLGLHEQALDATLVMLWRDHNDQYYHAALQGDGHILARSRSGGWSRWDVTQPQGAPYYASYVLDDQRKAQYLETYGHDADVQGPTPLGTLACNISDGSFTHTLRMTLDINEYDIVIGASDGLASFVGEDRAPIPVADVVESMLSFPQLTAGSLERRMRRFTKKDQRKLGWTNTDDLSVIMIAQV